MAKQRQVKMQQQIGTLAAMQQLENRTDEQLERETKHRAAARALLGARSAERYDAPTARKYFNEALAGAHPQERPYLRQVMKAALAQAERRPDGAGPGDRARRPARDPADGARLRPGQARDAAVRRRRHDRQPADRH